MARRLSALKPNRPRKWIAKSLMFRKRGLVTLSSVRAFLGPGITLNAVLRALHEIKAPVLRVALPGRLKRRTIAVQAEFIPGLVCQLRRYHNAKPEVSGHLELEAPFLRYPGRR